MASEDKANDNKRVMLIVAHPDDGEFMAAGTLAKWAKEGQEITYVLCTSGDKGTSDPELPPEKLAVIREREQRGAAKVVGAKEVVFLGYKDGVLENTLELRRDIVRQIRLHRPDVVVCQDPTRHISHFYLNHPDHRAAAGAALDAVFPSARDYHVFPELISEGLMPHKVHEVYLGGAGDEGTVWIDITDTIETKIRALTEHKSQVGEDSESLTKLGERVKEGAQRTGEGRAVDYAEAFRYIKLR